MEEANSNDLVPKGDEPASAPFQTRSGYELDMHNLPGKVKADLVRKGELGIDNFTTPANMPGKKLAELRRARGLQMEESMGAYTPKSVDEVGVGSFIIYEGKTYEVLKTSKKKGIQVTKAVVDENDSEVTREEKVWLQPEDIKITVANEVEKSSDDTSGNEEDEPSLMDGEAADV